MDTDSRRVQRFDAYVTYTATRTVDGADERAAIGCLLRSRPERVNGTVTTIGATGAGAGGMPVVNEARC